MSQNSLPGGKRLALSLSAAFLVLTLLMGLLAYFVAGTHGSSSQDSGSRQSSSEIEQVVDSTEKRPDHSSDSDADIPVLDSGIQEEEPDDSEPEPEPVYYNVPDELRAVEIVAGRDYMANGETAKATLATQIDQALTAAAEYTMNTVIIDTKYNDTVLFDSDSLQQSGAELDCTDYLVTSAREKGLYVYATYDVSNGVDSDGKYKRITSVDGDTLDHVAESAGAFAKKYKLDGILLTDYYSAADGESYKAYLNTGAGGGYEQYLEDIPRSLLTTAASAIRKQAPGTQVGILTSAVWQNSAQNEQGSQTNAAFTDLGSGHADTRSYIEEGLFDFVMVQNFGSTDEQSTPFLAVAQWWADVAKEADVALYMLHASDKVGTQAVGWGAPEQLTKQIIELDKVSSVSGSAFNSLRALQSNPGNSTTTLIQYMNDQIDEQYVLTQLTMQKPGDLVFTTKEQTMTFQGASDPQAKVTLNDEAIPTNDSGYFSINEELKAGLNTFVFKHKDKTITYQITRQVEVLKEVTPVGSINVEGSTQITIAALAYADANVVASIGGQNIQLTLTDADGDDVDRDSGYCLYTGVFTSPAATGSDNNIGTISVTATAQGTSKTMQGASVTVNKLTQMGEGSVIRVTADQAETFPIDTLNNNSSSAYYPLPKGTVDMTNGNEIVYKSGKNTYTYWRLQSGVRVYSSDIQAVSGGMAAENVISDMTVQSSGQYTNVTLKTREKVPYTVSYDGTNIVFKFKYTTTVPDSATLKGNALFSSAAWDGANLSLKFLKTGGFLGYKAYYDGDNLVLRFNNSPGSLKGARIVVDPGHGGNDIGASGFYPGKDEADINLAVAQKLVSELKSRGATVLMTTPGTTMATRLASARAFNAHVLVSIHCNSSATNSSAAGSEVYYFYGFQSPLATYLSANISSALGTNNRGAKAGLFYMTRESQFPCVLSEIGFVSNETEYTKLINSGYQSKIAEGLANGLNSYMAYTYSGVASGSSGGSSGGGGGDEENEKPSSSTPSSSTGGGLINKNKKVTDVSLNKNTMSITVGQTATLTATIEPANATNKAVGWESDDPSVVTVSTAGKLTAKKAGSATITVYTEDGGFEDTCDVTVKKASSSSKDDDSILVDEIEIEGEDSVEISSRVTLNAVVYPDDADDTDVTWSISDTSIAKFSGDPTGSECKVEGLKNGNVTITAKAQDSGKAKATFKLKIGTGKGSSNKEDEDEDVTPKKGVLVQSITIEGPDTIEKGTRVEFKGTVSPANAEDPGIKWKIEGADGILFIHETKDENLIKVEGLKKGTAYLVGTAYDEGKVTQKVKITVTT